MRIGFLGKGGSGKTSLSSAFIKYLRSNNQFVLAIDADVNAHLQTALGLEGEPLFIAKRFEDIASFLESGRTDYSDIGVQTIPCFGTVPPSAQSQFISVDGEDPFINRFCLVNDHFALLVVGPHEEEDFSNTCYHFNLNALELVFHRLADGETDRVVTDLAAGTDSLGTSLFMVNDLSVFAVEPTQQSISVFNDYVSRVEPFGIPVMCVMNKVRSASDVNFIKSHISQDLIIAELPYSRDVVKFEQGDREALDRFMETNRAVFAAIEARLAQCRRDWGAYYKRLTGLYDAECRRWWNGYYQKDITGRYPSEPQLFDQIYADKLS